LFSAPPGRKQPYRAPQAQNNQNASGNVIAGMHGAAFGASIAAFPRRISRDPLELWSRLQRSAVTPLPNVKCSCISDSGQTSWAEQKKLLFHREACALQSRSGLIADVRFGSKADIEATAPDFRFTPKSRHCRTTLGCLRVLVPVGPLLIVGDRKLHDFDVPAEPGDGRAARPYACHPLLERLAEVVG
jgi:hypothetical protein